MRSLLICVASAVCLVSAAQAAVAAEQTGCGTLPGAATGLTARVSGQTVTLQWSPASGGCAATDYVVEAGSAPGLSDLATLPLTATALTVGAPPGRYYVRVRGRNAIGLGAASNEIIVVVGTGCDAPAVPSQLESSTTATSLSLRWSPGAGGGAPREYLLEFGSQPGASNLAIVPVPASTLTFSANAPAGRYFARVRARNACGVSAASEELTITVGRTLPGTLDALLALFGNRAERGPIRVFSTISQSFSDAHADHAQLTWNYLQTVFAKSMGPRTEMYYTHDTALYQAILTHCPTVYIPGARNLTACWNPVERIYLWVIIPYITPDFGTQLHELSHSFLYATWPAAETNVWLKEGSGMYFESGTFVGPDLVINRPLPYLTNNFRRWYVAGRLVPLRALVAMSRDLFYGQAEPTLVYSQAGMFYYYLMKEHPAMMSAFIAGLNSGTLRNNADVLAFITSGTGMNLDALDQAYTTYALRF